MLLHASPSPHTVGYTAGRAPDPQLAAALQKIAAHIGSSKKFRRASGLLRELLASGKLQRDAHGQLAFAALCSSMQNPANVRPPFTDRLEDRLWMSRLRDQEPFIVKKLVRCLVS